MFNAAVSDRAQYARELVGPYVIGALAGGVAYSFAHFGASADGTAALMDRVYSGVLSVASVLVGFAFGFYTLILTRATPFLDRISRNRAYRLLLVQSKEAVFWLLMLTILSAAYYVWQLVPVSSDLHARGLFALWVAIAVSAISCCWRVSLNTLKVLSLE